MFRKFRDQPWYLFRYMLVWTLVLGALSALLWSPPPSTAAGWLLALTIALVISTRFDAMLAALIPALALSPEPGTTLLWLVLLLPVTWSLGVVLAVFIHNASHDQFRPRWLNPVVGELAGWCLRVNLLGWKMVQYYHHRYADDPERDPHPPGTMRFWPYANSMQDAHYLHARHQELHGMSSWFYLLVGVVAFTGFALMPLSWYLLLGPTWFAAVWMPILLSGWWLYVVINYYTHPPGVDGRNHAVDLCARPWHRLVNRVGFGVLYHAAHHRNARLFNPRPASSAG